MLQSSGISKMVTNGTRRYNSVGPCFDRCGHSPLSRIRVRYKSSNTIRVAPPPDPLPPPCPHPAHRCTPPHAICCIRLKVLQFIHVGKPQTRELYKEHLEDQLIATGKNEWRGKKKGRLCFAFAPNYSEKIPTAVCTLLPTCPP